MYPMSLIILVACCLFAGALQAGAQTGSRPAWSLPASPEVEREGLSGTLNFPRRPLASPAQNARLASQLYNGRPPQETLVLGATGQSRQLDWFQCVDPSRELFQTFANQYNRTFESGNDEIERFKSFTNTLRRTILLNRIIQNEISNETNFYTKREIRNYHFISPIQDQTNIALWYSDITDCELGLIKHIVFDLFYLIDQNDLAGAYRKAIDNSNYLPLLNDEGFEQLANILLLKLYDRFKGDEKMNQLFQWPLYLKKLAAFAYNRRQLSQPDSKMKLSLIQFAYPTYYKDLKYNLPAVNRTKDNLHVHEEHENFNRLHNRKMSSLAERNRRLSIFRQRLSYLESLNEDPDRWRNISFAPEWVRPILADGRIGAPAAQRSENLREGSTQQQQADTRYRLTQFSDLTDEEFLAYLWNDYSLLENRRDSVNFIESNFPVRPLDDTFRAELAHELELRRSILDQSGISQNQQDQQQQSWQTRRSLTLARRVIDELITDVGLPVGSVTERGITEAEHHAMFQKLVGFFDKPYVKQAQSQRARLQLATGELPVSSSDLLDERQRRYEQFKLNYGRFKAWFVKEDWQLEEEQMLTMLRLADLSWQEIKLSLFRICCLTDETFANLAQTNATIAYLGSNQFLCQQMGNDLPTTTDSNRNFQLQNQAGQNEADKGQQQELAALQLYYYYCVHFNKHHNDVDSFNKRFAIFRHNIDHIRRHSCTRGLSLFASLKLRLPDTFSTIDELDPRRSNTDDINLDRFKYFVVTNLSDNERDGGFSRLVGERSGRNNNNDGELDDDFYTFISRDESSGLRSRAGISYRGGSFFNSVSQQARNNGRQRPSSTSSTYADRLLEAAQNGRSSSQRYRQNSVDRIYELVIQRYRHCLRAVGASSSALNAARQQNCSPSGELVEGGTTWNEMSYYNKPAKLEERDPCSFYRLGLEPWAEGLIKQDSISPVLIKQARC